MRWPWAELDANPLSKSEWEELRAKLEESAPEFQMILTTQEARRLLDAGPWVWKHIREAYDREQSQKEWTWIMENT